MHGENPRYILEFAAEASQSTTYGSCTVGCIAVSCESGSTLRILSTALVMLCRAVAFSQDGISSSNSSSPSESRNSCILCIGMGAGNLKSGL